MKSFMEKILCLLHTDADGNLPQAALEAVAIAKAMNTPHLEIGIFGLNASEAAKTIGNSDASKYYIADQPELSVSRYNSDVAAGTAIAQAAGASIIIVPATSRMNRMCAGMARRLGGSVDTHVTDIVMDNEKPVITRWYYRQRIFARQTRNQRPWIIVAESGITPPWQGARTEDLPLQRIEVQVHPRSRVIGIHTPAESRQTIRPNAPLLFVAGAGWCKKQAGGESRASEAEALILQFINKTGASLGSSKSLVDQTGEGNAVLKCLSHMNQIGQTGSSPRHPKGLAMCCHGEEPHTVGWRFVGQRRVVNLDAGCGWTRGKADVVYVADAFEVIKKLNILLD